jgi:hypothetical protein
MPNNLLAWLNLLFKDDMLMTPFLRFIAISCITVLLGACALTPTPPPNYADFDSTLPCMMRIGRCFDATIAGQPVQVIANEARQRQILAQAQAANNRVRDLYWEVAKPVDGDKVFDIQVSANNIGRDVIGKPVGPPEITVYPLSKQKLASTPTMVARDDVRIHNNPTVTQVNQLNQDFLPPGRYVLAIRYRGSHHDWERKFVLVTVR